MTWRRTALLILLSLALAPWVQIAAAAHTVVAPEEHRRGEDQTYLTYPEWFLVFSPAEYARFLVSSPPSGFPFFGHVRQFWEAYGAVTKAMGERYPFNLGYHVMVLVIGVSTTVEYALKAGYEAVFGRWFEGETTPEDELAAYVAQDYVDFILQTPWYEYDFFGALGALWSEVPLTGPNMARKWERRFALTTEYLVKGGYAVLIRAGTQAGYEAPIPLTAVLLDRLPPRVPPEGGPLLKVEVLKNLQDGRVLVALPRYDAFKDSASALARAGVEFQEIAGNRGPILVSLLTEDAELDMAVPHRVLLEQQILTEPARRRHVVQARVRDLAALLRSVRTQGLVLEHIYDF